MAVLTTKYSVGDTVWHAYRAGQQHGGCDVHYRGVAREAIRSMTRPVDDGGHKPPHWVSEDEPLPPSLDVSVGGGSSRVLLRGSQELPTTTQHDAGEAVTLVAEVFLYGRKS